MKEKVRKYLDYCECRKELDGNTLKAYRIDLRQFFAAVEGSEPTKSEIEEYITFLHRKYKQKTVKRKIASVKAFYNYLEEEELIAENPFRKIKVRFKEDITLPRIIPRAEIEKLLNFMYSRLGQGSKSQTPRERRELLRDVAVIETLFATGARVYEISNLRADCIDLKTGLMRIVGKGGKERYIQIGTEAILHILERYYREHETRIRESGFFFVNDRGTRFTEQSMRLMLKKYTAMAGIERKITPHMFRHSFATYLIEEGVDVSCVQQILGHSSIRTTQIYIHIAAGKQAEILRELHPRNRMHIVGVA